MEKIAEFIIYLHRSQTRRGTFQQLDEDTWYNYSAEEKWCRYRKAEKEQLQLELVEVWEDGFITLVEVMIPAGRQNIRRLIAELGEDDCVDGELTDAFLWKAEGTTLHPSDSEPVIIEKLCIELGKTTCKRIYRSKKELAAILNGWNIDVVRVMGEGDMTLKEWLNFEKTDE
ncbi:hypothetical protein DNH61_09835 [Paenibacillus sambharensis]|uniref:Uncharacterized protein n=1 Tax=Paenibacillus sambharensis TaxID=1803190 RepID=A0A2W1LDP4_9BACL|nr:hypothetical protein [Paenibacillus sambharensis]PZD96190.1 hypothetical protein DNH61_09835 [Paenibacillus sambharensis]